MATIFDRFSFLNFFNLFIVNNFTFWDSIIFRDLSKPREDDIKVVITKADRIDLISNKFYGTPQLWWVIALANNMRNISTDFRPGREIVVPSSEFIDKLFSGI